MKTKLSISLIVAALAVSCAPVPAPKPTTSQPPIVRPLAVHTCEPAAKVWLDGAGVPSVLGQHVVANGDGYALFPVFPGDVADFNVHAAGPNHAEYGVVVHGVRSGSDGVDLFLGDCEAKPRRYPQPLQLAAWPSLFTPLPALHVDGEFFKTANGDRWFGIETSEFSIFARWLDGEDVAPVLQQRKDLGFNLLRVWTRFCNIPGIVGCSTLAKHPDLYERLPAFLRLVNGYGFYVDLMAYVGPNNETDPQHWSRLCEAVRGPLELRGAVLLSLVNENDIHPIDLWPFKPCAGVLSSRGSVGSQAWPQDGEVWDWTEFHTNGAPEWQRKSGHNGWEIGEAYHVPVVANENTSAQADRNPAHHEDAGAGDVPFIAGAAFHSSEGKDSVLFSAETAALARAFVAGIKRVPLRCRELSYERLDPGAFLRVYRFGGDNACRVEIRP